MSSSASEGLNTFSATSLGTHENLTSIAPSTDTDQAQGPIFCCNDCTVVQMRDNLPEETECIDAFVNYAHSLRSAIPIRLEPHIITVRYVRSTDEPNSSGAYDGKFRFFGLSGTDSISKIEKILVVDGTVPPYTEIFPTSPLLQEFRQTGVLGFKCEAHGEWWFEVAIIEDCDGEDDDDSDNESDEGDDEARKLDQREMDNSTEADASSEALDVESGSSATNTEIVPAKDNLMLTGDLSSSSSATTPASTVIASSSAINNPPATIIQEMGIIVHALPKTPVQRKNEKRRANEEARKKDNQRRMEQRKKAAAAKRAARGGAGVAVGEAGSMAEIEKGEEVETDSVEEDDTGSEGTNENEQTAGWWFCVVM